MPERNITKRSIVKGPCTLPNAVRRNSDTN